ncbi:MAG: ATP-binding protein [Burkholderiales bacterium]|nr:ATP-binding protein [Burkholderiales bacterium]
MPSDPTLIGTVQDVSGSTVTVELTGDTVTGLSFVDGEAYRIGQVGSFVRIPLGYVNLYGVVSQVGAGAAPLRDGERALFGNRWLRIQLVGEGAIGGRFERGVSQHPTVEDRVHIVTEADLRAIYGPGEPDDFVSIGRLASAESIPALVDINKLVTRHSAVVGSTGAGKSTTVAGLLGALSHPTRYPSSRVVVLDIHGEYAKALRDRATVFRISADETKGERPLHVPFWALTFEELADLVLGRMTDTQIAALSELVLALKKESLSNQPLPDVDATTITVDSPIPFCLHKLWFELHKREHHTLIPRPGAGAEEVEPAYVLRPDGQAIQLGDAMTVTPPQYRTVKMTGPANERVQHGKDPLGIRQHLAGLASKLRDPRFAFLLRPGKWLPDITGKTELDLDVLLTEWIGGPQPIAILDLSGIPSSVLNELIGALLRILYDALFWARNLPEGGRERPLLVVLEEAHAYLNKEQSGTAATAVRRIAKEGRKYGVGLMIVSQRPSEIDATILSQCGTIFAMRLANDTDRGQVTSAATDNLKGLFDMLPVLRTGEAIVVGEAVSLPIRTLIEPPSKDRLPDSVDPRVAVRGSLSKEGFDGPGGWNQRRDNPDYAAVVRQWRKQDARYEHKVTLAKPGAKPTKKGDKK